MKVSSSCLSVLIASALLAGPAVSVADAANLTAKTSTITHPSSTFGPSMNISQLDSEHVDGQGVTARYISSGNIRSLTQTFTWNSDFEMQGVGLLIDLYQNVEGKSKFFTGDQAYFLDVQLLNNAANRQVVSTVATFEFTITASSVVAGQFLYIDFDSPLKLSNGSAYGFSLRPAEEAPYSLSIARTSSGSVTGVANQIGHANMLDEGNAYGNGTFNLALFTVAAPIPEPSSAGFVLGGIVIAAGCLRRRR